VRKLLTQLRRTRAERRRFAAFSNEFNDFKRMLGASPSLHRFQLEWDDRIPILDEKTSTTAFDRHYIYHTAWAARIVAKLSPTEHTDISSSLFFCGILSAFVPTRFYDYRPADLKLSELSTAAADLLRLPFASRSLNSLSCMHVVEHVGLARYGDPLDPDGDLKAMLELQRVLAPGGSLLFVVPVGRPRICFNAHRIYSYKQIRESFRELELVEFTLIPDDPSDGGLIANASASVSDSQNYGCGCFWFRR
jgi:SAM-dependent methyltransferase